jgi:hypothetical protein
MKNVRKYAEEIILLNMPIIQYMPPASLENEFFMQILPQKLKRWCFAPPPTAFWPL